MENDDIQLRIKYIEKEIKYLYRDLDEILSDLKLFKDWQKDIDCYHKQVENKINFISKHWWKILTFILPVIIFVFYELHENIHGVL